MSGDEENIRWHIIIVIGIACLAVLLTAVFIFDGSTPDVSHGDTRIISSIEHAKTTMTNIYVAEGNYDSFGCDHKEVVLYCQEISKNYYGNESKDDRMPVVAHDAPINSQAACIYSPLSRKSGWLKKKNIWYCIDSAGHAGYTLIDPGSTGYCVNGKSAVCPPVLKQIP